MKHISTAVCILGGVWVLWLLTPYVDRLPVPAYEYPALNYLLTIRAANTDFVHDHPQQGYAPTLQQLAQARGVAYDLEWTQRATSSEEMDKYSYRYVSHHGDNGTVDSYEVFADPLNPSKHGARHFFLDQTGIIRVSDHGPAGKTSHDLDCDRGLHPCR
jgi:hypothetical protein